MRSRPFFPALCASLVLSSPALAFDLQQAYQAALNNDPIFAAARASYAAGQEKLPQARAGLLPSVSVVGNRAEESTSRFADSRYTSESYSLQLVQPLFRWGNWQTYEQSKLQVAASEAQFEQSRQDLIVRVAQAYFDLLAAQDSLSFLNAQKAAITEQLDSARRNYETGTATVTDTYEAQARLELAETQRLRAESDYQISAGALQQIIGFAPGDLAQLPAPVAIPAPEPAVMQAWTDQAIANNLAVTQASLATEIARRDIAIARSGHYPTVDLVANLGRTRGLVGQSVVNDFYTDRSVGVQLNVPIFSGLGTSSRVSEAVSLSEKARRDLEAARRAAAQSVLVAFQGVTTGLAQVRSLEAARESSQKALRGNKAGYEVGVRINIDVLDAQQQLYSTERDLSRARYDTLVAGLRLKAAAGTLSEADVRAVNGLLQQAPGPATATALRPGKRR